MKISLIGYGRMGKIVEKCAKERGHSILSKVEKDDWEKMLLSKELKETDVCIEFTHPDSVLENIRRLIDQGKNIVVGTTGWDEHIPEVKQWVKDAGVALLYAQNFSLGVHLFLQIVSEASKLMNSFQEYDVAITEVHHRQKADYPSGTAKVIAERVLDQIDRKKKLKVEQEGVIKEEELSISSSRVGSVPGTHSVLFDSSSDTITLTHEAHNREGFAYGAVAAAEWIQGKNGFFTIEDMI